MMHGAYNVKFMVQLLILVRRNTCQQIADMVVNTDFRKNLNQIPMKYLF